MPQSDLLRGLCSDNRLWIMCVCFEEPYQKTHTYHKRPLSHSGSHTQTHIIISSRLHIKSNFQLQLRDPHCRTTLHAALLWLWAATTSAASRLKNEWRSSPEMWSKSFSFRDIIQNITVISSNLITETKRLFSWLQLLEGMWGTYTDYVHLFLCI